MTIPYDFYKLSYSDLGNVIYFRTEKAGKNWLKEQGYVLEDAGMWNHVYIRDGGKSRVFLLGETFEDTFDAYVPTFMDRLWHWLDTKLDNGSN